MYFMAMMMTNMAISVATLGVGEGAACLFVEMIGTCVD
jgi:hypothetical protein